MRKALITGSRGFVGPYLRRELEAAGCAVVGLDVRGGEGTIAADLLDAGRLRALVEQERPDAIFHLAGQANVARSWEIPQKTVELNVIGAVNLLEAVRAAAPGCRVLLVGSSDQYGNLGEAGRRVDETLAVRPQTPYAVSKCAQEEMARVYGRAYGLDICMTRSFNHAGPGQARGFLISDFASGIAAVERGEADCLRVGNLEARRDFTHVRDIVRAYRLIAERGRAGEVYNVGSGAAHSAREILDRLRAMARCRIPVEQDPARLRPSDTPVVCCDHAKLTRDTGWEPRETLETVLRETLEFYRSEQSAG